MDTDVVFKWTLTICITVRERTTDMILQFVITYLVLSSSHVTGSCYFEPTNQTLEHYCDWSDWLPWNCTRCGNNVRENSQLTYRQRGICCKDNPTVKICMIGCGFNSSDDSQVGDCVTSCPGTTSSSSIPDSTTPW